MTISELKQKVESQRTSLKEKAGKTAFFSESGPVSISLIDALVATIEDQQKQLDKLNKLVELWPKVEGV